MAGWFWNAYSRSFTVSTIVLVLSVLGFTGGVSYAIYDLHSRDKSLHAVDRVACSKTHALYVATDSVLLLNQVRIKQGVKNKTIKPEQAGEQLKFLNHSRQLLRKGDCVE